MSRSFKQYFESILASKLKKGTKVKNTNPDCEHAGSEGEVVDGFLRLAVTFISSFSLGIPRVTFDLALTPAK